MKSARGSVVLSSCCSLFLTVAGAFAAGEPPDLELNPLTGYVESVDLSDADADRVRHVIDPGQGGSRTAQLISSAAGLTPRIAIKSNGESWVVWSRDSSPDELRYTYSDPLTGVWTAEASLGDSSEESRHPEIVHNGSATWVAYEIAAGASTSIALTGITDSPEPFPQRTIVATTSFAGDVDVLVHGESGHVWTTWVDSSTHVGWSEYQNATGLWALPLYQPYAATTVDNARKSIRKIVLGL